jgi:hypothetical protein
MSLGFVQVGSISLNFMSFKKIVLVIRILGLNHQAHVTRSYY